MNEKDQSYILVTYSKHLYSPSEQDVPAWMIITMEENVYISFLFILIIFQVSFICNEKIFVLNDVQTYSFS